MLRIAHEDGKTQALPVIRLLKESPARKGFLEVKKFEKLVGLVRNGWLLVRRAILAVKLKSREKVRPSFTKGPSSMTCGGQPFETW